MLTTLVVCLVLALAQGVLQWIWFRRCDVKRDTGKKGLNLWLTFIPLVVSIFPYLSYKNRLWVSNRQRTVDRAPQAM